MTCDTRSLQNRGVAFALAEAEVIWQDILHDAVAGELKPVYRRQPGEHGCEEPQETSGVRLELRAAN